MCACAIAQPVVGAAARCNTRCNLVDILHCRVSFDFMPSFFLFDQSVNGLVSRHTFFFSTQSFVFLFFFAPLPVQRVSLQPRGEARCASTCAFSSNFHDAAILLHSGLDHETPNAGKASDCVASSASVVAV